MPRGRRPTAAERALLGAYGDLDPAVLSATRCIACVRRWLDVEAATGGARRASLVPARRVLQSELEGALSAFG